MFSNDYIVFGDLGSSFVTFFSRDTNLNSVTLDNINLDDDGFDYCDPETINQVRLIGCYNKYKQRKASKKSRWRISGVSGFFWCFLDWDIKTVGVVNNLRAME